MAEEVHNTYKDVVAPVPSSSAEVLVFEVVVEDLNTVLEYEEVMVVEVVAVMS